MLILGLGLLELFEFFGRKVITKFIKVNCKISTMVAFCPGGLLSAHLVNTILLGDFFS